ncbi:hypothetical protein [Robertkochia flava]|uniref:hypothetical protein n=1 Tax=Robertkochia flava TaxID=3447986 RepID=UPI001CCEC2F7|nr:hypothetical protein [Robertkochia marina]
MLFGTSPLGEADFYDFDPYILTDDVVYTSLDVLALVPDPRWEAAMEFTGLVYATLRNDMDAAVMYNAALAIPFSSARIFRESLPDGFATVARLEGEDLLFSTKPVDQIESGELQLTPVLTGNEKVARRIEEVGYSHFRDTEAIKRLLNQPLIKRQWNNLLEVPWESLPDCYRCERDALEFWEDVTEEAVHYRSGDYYIKHLEATGEILVGDVRKKEVVAFFRGVENTGVLEQHSYADILRTVKRYFGISEMPSGVTFNFSNGLSLASSPEKCTTVIGNYATNGRGSGGDMKGFIQEILLNLKHQDFEGRKNGFNVLNVSDAAFMDARDFWEDINKPWLLRAIERGDAIYAGTDPMDLSKVFRILDEFNSPVIRTAAELEKNLKSIMINSNEYENLTGLGKELKLLFENGYSLELEKYIFIKND